MQSDCTRPDEGQSTHMNVNSSLHKKKLTIGRETIT